MSNSSDKGAGSASSELRGATWFLVGAAALTTEAARWTNLYAVHLVAYEFVASSVLAIGIGWLIRRVPLSGSRWLLLAFTVTVVMGSVPIAFEFSARNFVAAGQPPEVFQLAVLRNLTLAVAAMALTPKALRVACVLSLFLVLGGLVVAQGPAPYLLSIVYGVVGLWWLMGAHWDHVNLHRAASTRIRMPKSAMGGSFTIAVALTVLGTVAVARWERVVAISGWFWGSGGELYSDPYAMRGEQSGSDVLAATKDVDVIGATESDIFLSSHKPSLFDMFSDMLGDIVKNESSGDAQSISYQETAAVEKKLYDDKSGDGGNFNTRRQPTPNRKAKSPAEERGSKAVMMVTGRTPLHLRLATFDTFNGSEWSRSDVRSRHQDRRRRELTTIRDVRRGEDTWFEVERSHDHGVKSVHREVHKIAIVNLQTNRVPCPTNPQAIHIDKVDRTGLIQWHDEGCFFMPGRTEIPSLQVLNIESVTSKPKESASPLVCSTSATVPREVSGTTVSKLVRDLAKEWTREVEQPHEQISAIVARLREHCRFIPRQIESTQLPAATGQINQLGERAASLAIEPTSADTIDAFLSETRAGPDYMFAGAAVRLLQAIGFEARLASGFYVSDAANRRIKKQTSVLPEDLHFWAEVMLEDGNWLTVDPSPGFRVLAPPRSMLEVARDIALSVWEPVARHPIAAALTVLMSLGVWWWRHRLFDGLSIARWRLGFRSRRAKTLAALAILERRFRWEGMPRPRQTTIRRWLRQYLPADLSDVARNRCLIWIDEASRCLYAEHLTNSNPPNAINDESEIVLNTFSIAHIARFARQERRSSRVAASGERRAPADDGDVCDQTTSKKIPELTPST